jgi:hypothetical protein
MVVRLPIHAALAARGGALPSGLLGRWRSPAQLRSSRSLID